MRGILLNQEIFTIIVILVMFILLVKNIYEPVVIFFAGVVIFLSFGIVSFDEVLSGFSNKGMMTVAGLFVIAGTIQKNPYIYSMANYFFGNKPRGKRTFCRVILPVTCLSAFINNTPVVAIFIPMIRKWALNNQISPSKLLIPLSYASIFGGMLTLIGTSTNLLVSGLLEEYGYHGLGMFEITKVGLFLAITGMFYLIFIARRFLPNNEDLLETAKKNYRKYLITMTVEKGCKIIDKPVKKAGLRNLEGLYLVEVIRDGERIHPVNPEKVIIKEGDELVFTGQIETIVQLQTIKGLRLHASCDDYIKDFKNGQAQMVEAVVSDAFPFLNQTIKESNFRAKYDAAVVAVLRKGKRINEKIGNIKLRPGDTLLMLTSKDFFNTWGISKDFYIISNNVNYEAPKRWKKILSITSFIGLIILASLNILSVLHATFIALALLFVTRSVSPKEAWKYINWDTIIIIALSFGVGKALINSGVADLVANNLVNIMKTFGPIGVLAAVFVMTNIFTEMITNNAAAVLSFPIAMSMAGQMGLDPRPFAIAVAIGASTCFASPIGYQTNLMVYGPGGYKFTDFMKVGIPLNIIFMIISLITIPIFFPF